MSKCISLYEIKSKIGVKQMKTITVEQVVIITNSVFPSRKDSKNQIRIHFYLEDINYSQGNPNYCYGPWKKRRE